MRSSFPRHVLTRLESSRVVVYSLIAGALVGLLGGGLRFVLDALSNGLAQVTHFRPPGTPGEGGLLIAFGSVGPLALLTVPLLAGLAAAVRPAGPDGPLEDAVRRYHAGRPVASFWDGGRSLLATILAYLSGAGVGRDGPFTALGSLSARLLVRLARLSPAEARTLTLSCVGASLGLVLHAPLAAAVLMVEVLYRRFEFELEVLLPGVLASVAGYTVYGALLGFSPLVAPSVLQPPSLDQTPGYAAVALATAGAAWLVAGARAWLPDPTRARPWHVGLTLLFGALAAGLIWLVPELLGDGSGWWQLSLSGFQGQESLTQGALRLVLLLGVAWLELGGTILSALSAGGLLGAGLASAAPALGLDPAVASLVGAAAFLTTSHNVPVAATLLLSAWAGDAMLPALFAGTLLAHALTGETSLLRPQLRSRAHSPLHAAPPPQEGAGSGSAPREP